MRNALLIIAIMIFSSQAKGQLAIGDTVPHFELTDQNGQNFDSKNVIGKSPVVIYFYPKDDTPGCTKEACSFRDHYQAFSDAGVRVIGISSDNEKSHKKFAEKYNLPFTLLADTKGEVRKMFGVKGDLFGLIPGRVTFVIDDKGIVRHIFNSQAKSEQHIAESLEAIEAIKSK